MNRTLSNFAREQLKEELAQCTEPQRNLFKQMYCHKNLGWSVDQCVDSMPDDKLDWALQQCERTVAKNLAV